MKIKVLKKVLENENIDYTIENVDGEFIYIETFSYTIEIFENEEGKYHLGTYRENEEEIKNERNVKTTKAVLNYIDKFTK